MSLRRMWPRVSGGLIAIVWLTVAGGCQLFSDAVQPHNWWKLNRVPEYSSDPFFSVPDTIPEVAADDPPSDETSVPDR